MPPEPPEPGQDGAGTEKPTSTALVRRPPQHAPGAEPTWEHLPQERWSPERIRPQPWNPRKPMTDQARATLKRGLAYYGMAGGLNVRVEDGMLIGGHQRYQLLTELIAEHLDDDAWLTQRNLAGGTIPVNPIRGMPDQVAMALNVFLNNKEAQGEFHMPALSELVSYLDAEGFDATLSGFDTEQLEDILTWTPDPGEGKEESEDVDLSVPRSPVAKVGDLYTLGRHRLLCGDSTSASDWERLMQGRQADGIFTDPPYGIAYEGKTAEKLTIQNDDLGEAALERLLQTAFGLALAHSKAGAAWYVYAPGGPLFYIFAKVLKGYGVWRQTIAWVKDRFVLSRQDYHNRDEPALVGETPGDEPTEPPSEKLVADSKRKKQPIVYGWKAGGRHYFLEDRTQDTFWTVERPTKSTEHPTMKPVELYRRGFRNSSKQGALWVDCFAGSGPSLVAAEQTGRTVYAMEKDPRFVDVIVKRWEQLTGETATLERAAS